MHLKTLIMISIITILYSVGVAYAIIPVPRTLPRTNLGTGNGKIGWLSSLHAVSGVAGRCISKTLHALSTATKKLTNKSFTYIRRHPKLSCAVAVSAIAGLFLRKPLAKKLIDEGINRNNLFFVRCAVKLGFNVNDYTQGIPLRRAIEAGNLPIIRYLVEHGADLNRGGSLDAAVQAGNLPIVRYLVEHGANINDLRFLDVAVEAGNFPLVRYLVEHGADVRVADASGWTALFRAVFHKNMPIIQYLVEQGEDVNVTWNSTDMEDKIFCTMQ